MKWEEDYVLLFFTFTMLRLMSSAFTLSVISPTLRMSGPASANLRIFCLFTPPLTSIKTLVRSFSLLSNAIVSFTCGGEKLSSIMISAPAFAASIAFPSLETSTSIFLENETELLTFFTA